MFKYKLKISLFALLAYSSLNANVFSGDSVSKALSTGVDSFSKYKSMFADNVNPNVANLITQGLGGNINVGGLFTNSKLPVEINCSVDDINFGQLSDMCSAYKKQTGQAEGEFRSLQNGFSFGGCGIKGNNSASCRNSEIEKACGWINNPDGKTVFGNSASNIQNKENMVYTGGDVYLKGDQCNFNKKTAFNDDTLKYGNKTNKEVQTEYLSPSKVSTKNEAGGSNVFWRPGKLNLYETCVKNALNNKKNPDDACKGEFYALPETKIEAKEQIANTVKTTLKDSSSGLGKKVNDIEKTLKSSSNPQCTNVSGGECKDPAYINNVKKPMDSMVSAEKADRIKKTEEEMASFQEHVKVATMPKYEITYPTQEVLNGLHPEQKADFVVASNKQMHQEALFNSSIQNLTELKKELIEISFKKAELSSKTFYPQAAIEEANRIMKNGF